MGRSKSSFKKGSFNIYNIREQTFCLIHTQCVHLFIYSQIRLKGPIVLRHFLILDRTWGGSPRY